MSPEPTPGRPGMPALPRPQVAIVWGAFAVAIAVAVISAVLGSQAVPRSPEAPPGWLFLLIAGPLVVVDLGIVYFVTSRMRRSAPADQPPDAVAATQVIVAGAVALGTSLMCCVFFFITREPLLLLLVVPAALMLLHWFPSEGRWAALRPSAPPGGEGRRSAMVRE